MRIQTTRDLEPGRTYFLPHELRLAQAFIEDLSGQIRQTVRDRRAALEASTENMGHDDGGQEAPKHENDLIHLRSLPLRRALENAVELEYPDPTSPVATIGSRIIYVIDGTSYALDLVGGAGTYKPGYSEVDRTSYNAPVFQAFFGRSSGQAFRLPDGRSVKILRVDQTAQIQEAVRQIETSAGVV